MVELHFGLCSNAMVISSEAFGIQGREFNIIILPFRARQPFACENW